MKNGEYLLECYSCGRKGDSCEFPIPRRCPECRSYEVHHPDAGLTKSSRKKS